MSEITGPVSEINYNGVAVPLSAGEKLYQHSVKFSGTLVNASISFSTLILTTNKELFTLETLKEYVKNRITAENPLSYLPILGNNIGIKTEVGGDIYIEICGGLFVESDILNMVIEEHQLNTFNLQYLYIPVNADSIVDTII